MHGCFPDYKFVITCKCNNVQFTEKPFESYSWRNFTHKPCFKNEFFTLREELHHEN